MNEQLMSRLQVSRVHSERDLSNLTERNSRAAGHGALKYRVTHPGEARDRYVSIMGNATVGKGEFSYINDQVGKETTFLSSQAISICISSVLEGRIEVRSEGDKQLRSVNAGGAVVFHARPGWRVETSPNSARMHLWLDCNRLQAVLEAKLDHELTAPLMFDAAQTWPAGAEQALQRAVAYAAAELADPLSFFSQGIGTLNFEEMVAHSLLDGVPHNYSSFLHKCRRPVPRRVLKRAEAFMRSHLDQSITVGDIALAAGCAQRTLLDAFQADRGQNVISVLRNLRLDAAHDLLTNGQEGLSIISIALRYGFSNPGRFAVSYRGRFGESPSETTGRKARRTPRR